MYSEHSDQGLHYLPFSTVWSGSTLLAILSSLIKVCTVILSNLIRVYTSLKFQVHCHSQEQSEQDLHYLPFSVWSGSAICAILSSLIVHSYKSRSSIMKIYTVCYSQQSDQGLYYLSFSAIWSRSTLSFSAVWSGSTLFAIRSSLIKVKVHCHPQEQSDQGLHYLPF